MMNNKNKLDEMQKERRNGIADVHDYVSCASC